MSSVAWAPGRALAAWLSAAALIVAGSLSPAEAADYKFRAEYRISLNGLKVGQAKLLGRFDGAQYRLDGSGQLAGLAGAFFDYSGSAAAAGQMRTGGPRPAAFSADATDGRESTSVRMTLVNNRVRELELAPPVDEGEAAHPQRVQLTEADRRDILDPMSALISLGGFDGRDFDRSACNRSVPVFNGRERFDVQLEYSGERTIESPRSGVYSGPGLVCEARYRAVAGHRADQDAIRYLEEKVTFEVVLVPVEGADLLVPYRVGLSTPLGRVVLHATRLVSDGSLPTRSAALRD